MRFARAAPAHILDKLLGTCVYLPFGIQDQAVVTGQIEVGLQTKDDRTEAEDGGPRGSLGELVVPNDVREKDAPANGFVSNTPIPESQAAQPSKPDTAETIAERAAELFAAKGFTATSVREIADAVGVTKPTLYYHFGSKDGLIRHIHESVSAVFETTVASAGQDELSLGESLPKLAAAFFEYADTHPATVRLMLRLQHLPPEESRIVDLESGQARKLAAISQLLQRAIDRGELVRRPSENLALSLLGCLSSHINHRLRQPPSQRPPAAQVAHEVIDLYLQGALRVSQGMS